MKADKKKAKAAARESNLKSKSDDKTKGKGKAAEDVSSGKKKAKKKGESAFDTDEIKLLPGPKTKGTSNAATKSRVSAKQPVDSAQRATPKTSGRVRTLDRGPSRDQYRDSSRDGSRSAVKTSTKNAARDGTSQVRQRSVRQSSASGAQGAAKAKTRPLATASTAAQERHTASRVAPKSENGMRRAVEQRGKERRVAREDDESLYEMPKEQVAKGAHSRAQERTRLKVKPTSAMRARQEYAESDEDAYEEEEDWEDEDAYYDEEEAQEEEEEEYTEDDDTQEDDTSEVKERALVQLRRPPEPQQPSKKEPKVKKSTLIIAAACAAVLFVGFCMVNFAPKKGGFPGGPGFGGEDVEVTIRTASAQIATLHDYVETNGEIECESSVECYPDIGGKIAKVFVALGDRVWKGTALAEVDPNEPGTYFINSVVYAPISGMVTATPKEVGTTVTTTTSITTIGNVSRLQIRAKVPERYVSFLKVGLKADIILEAYPDETFTATVRKISPVVDSDSRTKEILLRFDQSDARINAGMFAKLTLFTADYEGEIIVPSTAVVEKGGGKQNVFVLAGGGQSVSLREVETGKSVDNMIQILSGLNEGERVVIEGMTSLSDGALVRDITGGLQQTTLFAESASATQADSPPRGGSGAGAPPPGGNRGAAR